MNKYNTIKPHKKEIIEIIFEDDIIRTKKIIRAQKNELFISLMRKYIQSTGLYNKNLLFMYNSRYLEPNMNLNQIGILGGETIKVISSGNVKGGGGFCMNFTDLSKKIYEEHYFSNNAPPYRNVFQGINICGDCKYENCMGYNQEVIVPLEGIQRLDLIKERGNLKCPICRSLIEPKTVAFYLCKYKISGKKFENSKVTQYSFCGNAYKNDSLHYYDPIKNGETLIIELIIEITNYY